VPGGPAVLAESRWREENFLKYAPANYGIDSICDYLAEITASTKPARNPARGKTNAAVRDAQKALDAAERDLAALITGPAATAPAVKNDRIPGLQAKITRARTAVTAAVEARNPVPAKLPANKIDPDARNAVLSAGRRGLQMVLRLLAHNAGHWLPGHLNAYLRDDDEYRAITRETIIRGLAGTITCDPAASPSPSNDPAASPSHAPWNSSPTKSAPDRRTCPATPGPSPTRSPRTGFNCDRPATAGGLSPACAPAFTAREPLFHCLQKIMGDAPCEPARGSRCD
jgi:hypothetical protein